MLLILTIKVRDLDVYKCTGLTHNGNDFDSYSLKVRKATKSKVLKAITDYMKTVVLTDKDYPLLKLWVLDTCDLACTYVKDINDKSLVMFNSRINDLPYEVYTLESGCKLHQISRYRSFYLNLQSLYIKILGIDYNFLKNYKVDRINEDGLIVIKPIDGKSYETDFIPSHMPISAKNIQDRFSYESYNTIGFLLANS